MTPLDHAHAAMEAAADDAAPRLAFYATLRAAELFVLLQEEPSAGRVRLLVLETSDGPVALAFDREDRVADFVDRPTPFLGLSGRRLAALLAGDGVALGLNLSVAPSSIVIPPDAVRWLHDNAPAPVNTVEARPSELRPPEGVPEALLRALDGRLALLGGVAQAAWLAAARFEGGGAGHLLAITGVAEAARGAVAEAVAEALQFSGLDAAALDVMFVAEDAPVLERFARVGLRFDVPQAAPATPVTQVAPGSDPARPPRLV